MILQHSLTNGVRVLIESVEQTEVVSIGFWFLHGSRDESTEEKGYSHFLEHLLFKGTQTRTAFRIVQEIDRVGGILNAFTEKEQTCFYCTLAAQHLELAIQILSDMIFNSTFPEDEIEREKNVIINEIMETFDNPEELAYEHFLHTLWGDHPLADKITGEIENIQSISKEKVLRFYNKYYSPSNLLVSIAGKVEINTALASLDKYIVTANNGYLQIQRKPPVGTFDSVYLSGRFQQVQLFTGTTFPIPKQQEEFYHLLVFSTYFGESMSSRLFQTIREQNGLCYTIFSLRSFFTHTVMWAIYANTSPDLLNKLIDELNGELTSLAGSTPKTDEIDDARSHLIGSMILSQEDMEIRMKRLVRHYILGEEIHDMPTAIEILKKIKKEDIIAFLNNYIINVPYHLLVFGTKNLHKRKRKNISFTDR